MPPARRMSARARQRRRAARIRLAILSAVVVILLIVVIVDASGGSAKTSTTPAANTGGDTTTTKKHHKKHVQENPLTTDAVTSWIASRKGVDAARPATVSAAVLDMKTGKEWVINPSARDQTASIIKADILETLMHQTEAAGDPLADVQTDTAQEMIEISDDDDASTLWNQIGEGPGLAAFNTAAGLTQTTPHDDGYWGETLTSAADQIKILEQLAKPSKLLSKAAQAYQLDLMRNIDPGQDWGVTGGVPSGVSVALKNGWVNLTSFTDWEVNSIGWIKGDGHDYLLTVLTAHDPSEDYGIKTIHNIAADVYASLGTQGLTTDPLTGKSVKPAKHDKSKVSTSSSG